jgi:hypothetical protein
MAGEDEISLEAFQAFYREYCVACRNRDAAFLRRMLPPDVPADEFEFVLGSSQQFALGLEESGAIPVFERRGNRFDVVYRMVEGDDSEEWRLDFYSSGGRFLKYDPGAAGEAP